MSRNSKRYGFSFVVWHLFKYNGVIIAIRISWSTIIHSLKHIIFWSKDFTLILQQKFLRIKPILHSYIIALRIKYSKCKKIIVPIRGWIILNPTVTFTRA